MGRVLPDHERFVMEELADHGYNCGLSGKLHTFPTNPEHHDVHPLVEHRTHDGFSNFNWSHSSRSWAEWPDNQYHLWLARKGLEYEQRPFRDSEYVKTSMDAQHHQTTWCAERAVDFIETHEDWDRPWFFTVNPFDPHVPFNPPESYLERYLDVLDDIPLLNYQPSELDDKPDYQRRQHEEDYDDKHRRFPYDEMDECDHRLIRAAYWAMIDLIDDQVGRMLDALERTQQRENTIVVFTSDHGELLGDHGIYLKGAHFYEPAIRVPLIISMPGTIAEGIETDALVELVDLAPTLLEAADIDSLSRMQGESLWPILTELGERDSHKAMVYCESYETLGWHDDSIPPNATMVRTDRYKLVQYHRTEMGELYDLETDPDEFTNLWTDESYADVKMDMLDNLSDVMFRTVDPLPTRVSNW